MNPEPITCPMCESTYLVPNKIVEHYCYKGHNFSLEDIEYAKCPTCHSEVITPAQAKRNEVRIREEHNKIEGRLTRAKIAHSRTRSAILQRGNNLMERQYQILIIDDNSELLNTYHQFLTQHGFQVETAQDGLDGLDKLRHGEFDVALVSLQLPRLNGLELIRRATEEEIETDMIVLSDQGTKADAVAAIKAGVKDWFEKSDLDISHFLTRVKEVAEVIPLNKIGRIVSMFPVRN